MTELVDLTTPDWNAVPHECPMPVVRFDGYDEQGENRPVIVSCGEQLFVGIETAHSLDGGKYGAGLGYMVPAWKLECMGGHVLLVADIEDGEVELTPGMVVAALAYVTPPEAFGAGVALETLDEVRCVRVVRWDTHEPHDWQNGVVDGARAMVHCPGFPL